MLSLPFLYFLLVRQPSCPEDFLGIKDLDSPVLYAITEMQYVAADDSFFSK